MAKDSLAGEAAKVSALEREVKIVSRERDDEKKMVHEERSLRAAADHKVIEWFGKNQELVQELSLTQAQLANEKENVERWHGVADQRKVKIAAQETEIEALNVEKREQAEEMGVSLRDAATRVFSNAAGSYSANVGLAIENGGWEDEGQLQEQFLSRKGFAFNADKPGMMTQSTDMFKAALSTVDVTFQNLDSSEISISDVSHYYDSDPTKVVEGLRKDGKKPSSMMADTTTANAQVRSLSETVRLDARTKLLNPKFYEGMLASGYEGTREITKRLRNTMGWSATAGEVDNFVYEDANDTFIKDEAMQKRLLETNPNAFRDMVTTFLEANGRGYWDTDEENVERLQELYQEVEDRIEGIV